MLVTSWSEGHVGKVMGKDVHPFVSKISVIISGRGVATTILLNSAGDDEDHFTIQKSPHNQCPSNARANNDKISMRRELGNVGSNGGGWVGSE
jgi:hypothetical protein